MISRAGGSKRTYRLGYSMLTVKVQWGDLSKDGRFFGALKIIGIVSAVCSHINWLEYDLPFVIFIYGEVSTHIILVTKVAINSLILRLEISLVSFIYVD